ncbi:MAG: metallophosphoesterase [Deltaproteobacteria bacterium]|nr:metallophosphoesterase [Deltaproteobacteria bacterium]
MKNKKVRLILLLLLVGGAILFFYFSSHSSSVSFLILGDWGSGTQDQLDTAKAMGNRCAPEECDFVVSVGDNFYPSGVQSTKDPFWKTRYKEVYQDLELPFYAAIGNHDRFGNSQAQIDYSKIDSSWRMPGDHYSVEFPEGGESPTLELFVISAELFGGEVRDWLTREIDSSRAVWKMLVVHHPIISNGPHGDDEMRINDELLPIICNKIDLVLSGHDHLYAHLQETINECRIDQLILGAGGQSVYEANSEDKRVLSTASLFSFGWIKATKKQLRFQAIQSDGTIYDTFEK